MKKKQVPVAAASAAITEGQAARWADQFAHQPPQALLRWAFDRFGPGQVPLSSSFAGPAGLALLHMALQVDERVRVFTVDTGRLPAATYELIDTIGADWGVEVEVLYPPAPVLSELVRRHGINGFYRSVGNRLLCCHVRKQLPVRAYLQKVPAWCTGLVRGAAATRRQTAKVEIDHQHGGILKLNPLADWTEEQVWQYVRRHEIPYNALHDQGYTSIGCAPCTRPVAAGEGGRAGRWWWEEDTPKECGLHYGFPTESVQQELEDILTSLGLQAGYY